MQYNITLPPYENFCSPLQRNAVERPRICQKDTVERRHVTGINKSHQIQSFAKKKKKKKKWVKTLKILQKRQSNVDM